LQVLIQNEKDLFHQLLYCPVAEVKDVFIDLVMNATKSLLVYEEPLVVEANLKEIKVRIA
jgi:hypothetical protein